MKFRKIQELAAVFDSMERDYALFARRYEHVPLEANEFPGIPADLARVIKGVFGANASGWIARKIPAFDDQRAVDIVQTEAGRKAIQLILFRAPVC